ncbi:MAG TPA: hypothetical protein VEZ90_10080, partial [Blastocatellia bacterium]|nr:hypothetical protein [Blastocatellia bacterium]
EVTHRLSVVRVFAEGRLAPSPCYQSGLLASVGRRETAILLIYDCEGNVQAVSGSIDGEASSKAGAPQTSCEEPEPNHLGLFNLSQRGADETQSALGLWVASQIQEAKSNWPRFSQTLIETYGESFDARFQTLTGSGGLFGYALQLNRSPTASPVKDQLANAEQPQSDPATLITREQWHDIKNELGGLKLYATFLRKRHWGSEDLEVVDKLLNGINGLIDHLARIRRGETR